MDDLRKQADVNKGTCSTADCDRRATVRGMCGACYQEQRRRNMNGPCSIEGCDKAQRGAGMCAMHYNRMRRTGTTEPRVVEKKECAAKGCDDPSRSRGWCNFHYRRWVLTGDPHGATPSQRLKEAAQRATSKTCTKCQRELPLGSFQVRRGMRDGRRSECCGCVQVYHQKRSADRAAARPPREPKPKATCRVEDCAGFSYSKGYCRGHYERWRRAGDPTLTRILRPHRTEEHLAAEEKACSKCKRMLSIDSFNDRADSPDGKSYLCRWCTGARAAAVRKRYAEDPVFRDKRAEYHREYRQMHRVDRRERQRAAKLWLNYGMTLDEYEKLYREQNGVCRLCGSGPHGGPEWARKQWLSVDHDHATGEIRGLLCDSCNIGLGKFNDNPGVLQAAIKYLERTAD